MHSTGAGTSIKSDSVGPCPVELDRGVELPPAAAPHRFAERLESVLLGATVLYWTLRQGFESAAAWHPVTLSVIALNMTVAGLFVFRAPAKRLGTWLNWLWAIPCLAISGFFFHVAPPAAEWPLVAQPLFLAGVLLAGCSLISLGRSFSILPAIRQIASGGPYRWIRHPAYLGETIMALGCAWAASTWESGLLVLFVIPFVVWRIRAEEQLLRHSPDYVDYMQQVRWRLFPGIW